MATIKVVAALQKLFCFHGADEEESEPYLWTIMFTVDGRTITHTPNAPKLNGKPAFFFGPGSHGNLGGSINTGVTLNIPPAVGRFDTTLQPIVLNALGHTLEVPGHLGIIAILLEEDSTSDGAAEAAHQAINNLVKVELEEAVEDLDIAGIAAQAAPAIQAGTDPLTAVLPIFKEKMDRVSQRIQRVAKEIAIATIVQHLGGPGDIIDPDEFMGTITHFYSQTDLERTTHTERSEIMDRIAQPGVPLEASDFVYNLHGQVWQPVEVFFTPVTDQVPPGRWRVTGIARDTAPTHRPFISHLGGVFEDGSPWLLGKGQVMDMITAGTHTFFVRGSSGAEAEVFIDPNEDAPFFPFLATVADNDPTNNLSGLPQAVMQIRHLREVPG